MLKKGFSGIRIVSIWTLPPENSPGRSGEYVFTTLTPSSRFVGNRSRGTTRLSGSGDGMTEPLRSVWLYLSPRPRT